MAECGRETEFEHRLTEIEQRSKSNTKRIDELAEDHRALQSLATNMAVMTERQDSMDSSLKEIKSGVTALTEKPAKRWESVVEKVIGVIVGGIIGYILVRLGLG